MYKRLYWDRGRVPEIVNISKEQMENEITKLCSYYPYTPIENAELSKDEINRLTGGINKCFSYRNGDEIILIWKEDKECQ